MSEDQKRWVWDLAAMYRISVEEAEELVWEELAEEEAEMWDRLEDGREF